MNVDCFPEIPPIMFQKTQSIVALRKALATLALAETNILGHIKVVISFTAYSMVWLFNEAQGYSRMSPDPLLTGGAWAQDCRTLTPDYDACLQTVIPRPSYPRSQAFSGSSFLIVCKTE